LMGRRIRRSGGGDNRNGRKAHLDADRAARQIVFEERLVFVGHARLLLLRLEVSAGKVQAILDGPSRQLQVAIYPSPARPFR
jgi:hypothetical protein